MKKLDEILEFLFHTKRGIVTLLLGGMSSAMLLGGCFVTDCFSCVCDSSCDGCWGELDDCVNDCVSCDGSCENTLFTALFGAGCTSDCNGNECNLSCNPSDWGCQADCDGCGNYDCSLLGFGCAAGTYSSFYEEPSVSVHVIYYNLSSNSQYYSAYDTVYESDTHIDLSHSPTYFTCYGVYSGTSTSSTKIAESSGILTDGKTGADLSDGQTVYVLLEEHKYGESVKLTFSATVDGEDISTNSDFDEVDISGSVRVTVGGVVTDIPSAPSVTGYTFRGWYVNGKAVNIANGDIFHLYNMGTTSSSINLVAVYTSKTCVVNVYVDGTSTEYEVKYGTTIGDVVDSVKDDIETNYGRYLGVAYTQDAESYLSESIAITENCTLYVYYQKPVSITLYNTKGPDSGSEEITGYYTGDTFTLSDSDIVGYYFAGWYYDSGLKNYVVDYTMTLTDEEYTFYVNWADTLQVRVEYYVDTTLVNLQYYDYSTSSTTALWTDVTDIETGYELAGWCKNSSLTDTPVTSLSAGSAGTIKLYASFTERIYTVYLETNGGTLSLQSTELTYGEDDYYILIPTKSGSTFDGWYYADVRVANENGEACGIFNADFLGINAFSGDSITLVAMWSQIKVEVNYYLDNTLLNTIYYDFSETSDTALWTAEDVSGYLSTGYQFDNWATASGEPISLISAGTYGPLDLYAVTSLKAYTVYLETNGGTLSLQSTELTYGEEGYYIPVPTKSGSTFDGWYYASVQVTDENGEALGIFNTSFLGINAFNGDSITLIAMWSTIEVEVNYYLDNTLLNTIYYDFSETSDTALWTAEKVSSYIPAGYQFDNWATASGEAISLISAGTYGPLDLYAVISAKEYTIILSAGEGTINSQASIQTTLYYDEVDFYLEVPDEREGYEFAGWYYNGSIQVTDEYGNSLIAFTEDELGSLYNSTIMFTAQWTAVATNVSQTAEDGNGYAVIAAKAEDDD